MFVFVCWLACYCVVTVLRAELPAFTFRFGDLRLLVCFCV